MARNKTSDEILHEIQYTVWQGNLKDHFTFEYWKQFWTKLFHKIGSPESVKPKHFLNQEKVTTLMHGDEIIGMHLLTTYTEQDFFTHPYFSIYDEGFFEVLKQRSTRRVQALQYFSVDRKWATMKTQINFGAILASLSLRHQTENDLDASITVARNDIAVTSLGLKLGFEEVSRYEQHNVPVSFLSCFSPKPYPKEDVQGLIGHYWQNKEEIHISGSEERKAA